MKTQDHTSCRGFSLVELLIVVAVIGLIVAIAIPNLLNAIQRSKQTRTISDMRSISNGLGIYQQDYAKFPLLVGSLGELTVVSDGLVPFIGQVPLDDGWNNIFRYRSDAGDSYTLASLGVDLMANTPWESGFTSYFTDDIVILDGSFLQIPEGVQN